ncbi:gp53-like domain-containing protein [Xenorhabdus doucetiae]|uniref:gp53-like domain-containing protein n=1 Tax=Xenorhabdus doucetiae TaxID=351671 RepID=UPI0006981E03|nr:phage tail protein [Xenorhabdus doucetiae]
MAYSVTLGTEVGNFDFNWIGLLNKASGVIGMITHAPAQKKIKTANGLQGNVLTRPFLLGFDGAAKETAITTTAETWQIDFTARLSGMDEMQRLINTDSYGEAAFFGDGFAVIRNGDQYTVKKGLAYVGGLRGVLEHDQTLNTVRNTRVYADFSYQGNLVSQWKTVVKITVANDLKNYVDAAGYPHYVFAIASIDGNGNVIDLRPKGALSDRAIADLNTRKINGKSLSSDVNLNANDINAVSVFGGVIISDNKIIELRNATPNAANYIYGTDARGNARYLLGCGSGKNTVSLTNNQTQTDLEIGDKRAFIDGEEIATVKIVNDNANGRVPVTRKINGKSMRYDVFLNAGDVNAVSAFGGTIISDNKVIELRNATPGAANYIYGTDASGDARYLLGCGAESNHVSLTNVKTSTHLEVGNGSVSLNGKLLATVETIPTDILVKSTTGHWKNVDTGMILQWGTINMTYPGTYPIQFPAMFPTECVNVQMTISDSANNPSINNVQARDRTTTGFTAITAENGIQCNWFAVGY